MRMARQTKSSDQTLIELFLDMLAAERGAGVNTLAAYRRDLEDLSATLAGKSNSIAKAATDDLRNYLGALAKRGLKASSVARRLSAIRQFYRFLYAENHRRDDPAAVLEGPKRTLTLPKILSIADVDGLLKQAHADAANSKHPAPERLRAARLACLLEVLYAARLARFGVGRIAGVRSATGRAHAGGARQRQQGTARAAQRKLSQTGDDRLSGSAFAAARTQGNQMAIPFF